MFFSFIDSWFFLVYVEAFTKSCFSRQVPRSLLVVRRFDDYAAQRVSLCLRMWLLSPKAEA